MMKSLFDVMESSSSSSSSDSSDDDMDDMQRCIRSLKAVVAVVQEEQIQKTDYLRRVKRYSDWNFWRHFRVTRSSFQLIMNHMKEHKFKDLVFHGGQHPLDLEERLLITLKFLVLMQLFVIQLLLAYYY